METDCRVCVTYLQLTTLPWKLSALGSRSAQLHENDRCQPNSVALVIASARRCKIVPSLVGELASVFESSAFITAAAASRPERAASRQVNSVHRQFE
jgi:hypothetical protein